MSAPYLRLPERQSYFAQRQMRLLQLSKGHAMEEYLRFMAKLAEAQQAALDAIDPINPINPISNEDAEEAEEALPPQLLSALEWPRESEVWQGALRHIVDSLKKEATPNVLQALEALETIAAENPDELERQAQALLDFPGDGLDLASSPFVGAALQVYWVHLLTSFGEQISAQISANKPEDGSPLCPCCASEPVASITRSVGEALLQRYLHCSLCGLEWHFQRARCARCLTAKQLTYQALDLTEADDESSTAAQAPIQAQECGHCQHYLKLMHTDRAAFADPVADDLASLTLDLLLSEAGKQRYGRNLALIFHE